MSPRAALVAACLVALPLAGCAIAPRDEPDRQALDRRARAALAEAAAADPGLAAALQTAQGCAVFPSVGKGAAILGLAHGSGVYYERGEVAGYCDLSQGTLGLALGGQGFVEIVCLMSPEAALAFRRGEHAPTAQASAVAFALDSGTQKLRAPGMEVFVHDAAGLMLEAALGLQHMRFQPLAPAEGGWGLRE